ncbi:MAG: 30S ribosomal protein S16 [Fibrobacteria bacterium]|nr:30S ribosomal protein S16 [Fibrobacteria bacterium]
MAVKIRLARRGRNHYATYRIAVADQRFSPTGRFLQQIGHYDPNQKPPLLKIDEASAIEWMLKGAQVSDTVRGLFGRQGILEKFEQVKAGKSFEEATGTVIPWKEKNKKLSKKAREKAKAKEEQVEAEKAEAPAEEAKAEETASKEAETKTAEKA